MQSLILWCVRTLFVSVLLFGCKTKTTTVTKTQAEVRTNDAFVKGMYLKIDVNDPKAVFNHVFSSLPDSVTVFPSENVFYFKAPMLGKTYEGTITLYPHDRDSGILGFGYVNRMEQRVVQKHFEMAGASYNFTAKDGLQLSKINKNCYSVTYKDKTVFFNLNPLPEKVPETLQLNNSEAWVASTFDESGVQFHLIFNKAVNTFYWLLNDAVFVPESFHPISSNLVIGDRTEFVFYADTIRQRKVLVGVQLENVMQNNWYDGPFDHLPDNLIQEGKINLMPYLELCYPSYKGKIDKFGHFLSNRGTRIPIAAYLVYDKLQQLSFIDSLRKTKLPEDSFLFKITQQGFDVPLNYYDNSETYIKNK